MEELGETDNSVSLNHIVSYFPNKFCDNITILKKMMMWVKGKIIIILIIN